MDFEIKKIAELFFIISVILLFLISDSDILIGIRKLIFSNIFLVLIMIILSLLAGIRWSR